MEPQAKEATLGERAAEAAATLLERRGYRIVERDWKCDEGGFDVVASRDGTLVLAQVAVREGRGADFRDVGAPKRREERASAARRYLEERGVAPADFNTYGARRGNHEVMMRGTFANVKLQNKLAEGKKGGWTRDFATGEVRPLFDAAMDYEAAETPLVVVAGKMYGSGSSRDWAAKGPALLGIRAAFAESFERIHRSNLIGMGILPLQFQEGESAESLGLDGSELYTVAPIDFSQGLPEPRVVDVTAERADGQTTTFRATVRVDTPTEGRYYQHGGILPFVLRSLL